MTFKNNFRSFIMSRFLIDDHVLQSDRMSLDLERSFWAPKDSYQWSLLRQLINEIYTVKPEAYTATCLSILKCISDLRWGTRCLHVANCSHSSMTKSPLTISPSDAKRFPGLAVIVSSSLKAIEQYLVSKEQPTSNESYKRPYIPWEVVALWHDFCNLGGPLLEKAGPSMALQKFLKENERTIYLFSHMDDDEVRRVTMWKSIKKAIDGYLWVGTLFQDKMLNGPLMVPTALFKCIGGWLVGGCLSRRDTDLVNDTYTCKLHHSLIRRRLVRQTLQIYHHWREETLTQRSWMTANLRWRGSIGIVRRTLFNNQAILNVWQITEGKVRIYDLHEGTIITLFRQTDE